ncbi:putative Mutt domain protein [Heracleum sosnowskyi]|uniref:Mutt domain protein n=1 Tax=Heracleum sosnowskyi TaxID=360622 RepID=A0AAD8HD31_9APIA|nr:putative Mutt domain protein [Heracleum sosnowskyi]
MAVKMNASHCSSNYSHRFVPSPNFSWSMEGSYRSLWSRISVQPFPSKLPNVKLANFPSPFQGGKHNHKKGVQVLSPNINSPSFAVEYLDGWDDDYNGIIIDPESLPSSANAFASALKASLSNWKLKGKKGVWMKILQEQVDLVPIAIQEGFQYHHAEPGYVMLTYWIPTGPCLLPASPSHQIGIAGFVINEKQEILVVKEKCPCTCSGVWKLPTGYINKCLLLLTMQSEEIFDGAIREVKEETGIDTTFLEMVAFRHAQLVAFEKSDLMFVCMLKPLSSEITIDEKEIEDAKWIKVEELMEQPYYQEDEMLKRVTEICMAAHQNRGYGFTAHQLTSIFDGQLSNLYCRT